MYVLRVRRVRFEQVAEHGPGRPLGVEDNCSEDDLTSAQVAPVTKHTYVGTYLLRAGAGECGTWPASVA